MAVVLGLVVAGWALMWKLFLSRFKFVREILASAATANCNGEAARLEESPERRQRKIVRSRKIVRRE